MEDETIRARLGFSFSETGFAVMTSLSEGRHGGRSSALSPRSGLGRGGDRHMGVEAAPPSADGFNYRRLGPTLCRLGREQDEAATGTATRLRLIRGVSAPVMATVIQDLGPQVMRENRP